MTRDKISHHYHFSPDSTFKNMDSQVHKDNMKKTISQNLNRHQQIEKSTVIKKNDVPISPPTLPERNGMEKLTSVKNHLQDTVGLPTIR